MGKKNMFLLSKHTNESGDHDNDYYILAIFPF
jgi:hypothetical protein